MERRIIYFDAPGPANTDSTLVAAKERIQLLGIRDLVVATSTGDTALKAAKILSGMDIQIIALTLHAGYWKIYAEPDREKIEQAKDLGVKFITATHTLMGNVETALTEKFGGISLSEMVAYTYYTFGQGMKVAVEIVLMAADAGLISSAKEVLSVAGTNYGADTAIVLSPAYSINFLDLRIREIIAMPR